MSVRRTSGVKPWTRARRRGRRRVSRMRASRSRTGSAPTAASSGIARPSWGPPPTSASSTAASRCLRWRASPGRGLCCGPPALTWRGTEALHPNRRKLHSTLLSPWTVQRSRIQQRSALAERNVLFATLRALVVGNFQARLRLSEEGEVQ